MMIKNFYVAVFSEVSSHPIIAIPLGLCLWTVVIISVRMGPKS